MQLQLLPLESLLLLLPVLLLGCLLNHSPRVPAASRVQLQQQQVRLLLLLRQVLQVQHQVRPWMHWVSHHQLYPRGASSLQLLPSEQQQQGALVPLPHQTSSSNRSSSSSLRDQGL
jgi:hypothetical protein